jgi:ribosome-associated toxin RatA of RatAB toxin-antitoxin module
MLKRIALTLFLVISLAFVAVLSIAATRPPAYHVERSVSTAAPPQQVFDLINDLHRFPEWSPWQKLDPNMKVTYEGPATGAGASYSWEGKAGVGRMTTTEATPHRSITQKLEILKPFKSEASVRFTIEPEGDGSRVTWAMDGNYDFVSKVMCLFVSMDSMLGKDFETGLANLRQVTEAPASSAAAPTGSETTAAPAKP